MPLATPLPSQKQYKVGSLRPNQQLRIFFKKKKLINCVDNAHAAHTTLLRASRTKKKKKNCFNHFAGTQDKYYTKRLAVKIS